MGFKDECAEFAQNDGMVYIFNTNAIRQTEERSSQGYEFEPCEIGPVAVMSVVEYSQRHRLARLSDDPTKMFANKAEHETFTVGEMQALADYIAHPKGLPEQLKDGQIVTAFEHRGTLSVLQEAVVL